MPTGRQFFQKKNVKTIFVTTKQRWFLNQNTNVQTIKKIIDKFDYVKMYICIQPKTLKMTNGSCMSIISQ